METTEPSRTATAESQFPQQIRPNRYDVGMELVEPEPKIPPWTFLTNHAHVLIAIGRNPEIRQRDIAYAVGITVGAVTRIVNDLEAGGYLRHERVGRRNRYEVVANKALRHPLESQHTVEELLTTLNQ